jgi:hypothetical protein
MKISPSIISSSVVAAVAAFSLAGCDTFQSRAREKSATYEALPSGTQERLQRGAINVGDTPDMVYIALGHPDEKRQTTTNDGTSETWIYRTYWEQYEGTAWAGWRRIIVPAANGRGYVIFHEPVRREIYSTHADEVIRVTLNRGAVVSVEQSQRR